MPYLFRSGSFNIANGSTDVDIRKDVATANNPFVKVTSLLNIRIASDQNITIKFNDTDEPAVSLVLLYYGLAR